MIMLLDYGLAWRAKGEPLFTLHLRSEACFCLELGLGFEIVKEQIETGKTQPWAAWKSLKSA